MDVCGSFGWELHIISSCVYSNQSRALSFSGVLGICLKAHSILKLLISVDICWSLRISVAPNCEFFNSPGSSISVAKSNLARLLRGILAWNATVGISGGSKNQRNTGDSWWLMVTHGESSGTFPYSSIHPWLTLVSGGEKSTALHLIKELVAKAFSSLKWPLNIEITKNGHSKWLLFMVSLIHYPKTYS